MAQLDNQLPLTSYVVNKIRKIFKTLFNSSLVAFYTWHQYYITQVARCVFQHVYLYFSYYTVNSLWTKFRFTRALILDGLFRKFGLVWTIALSVVLIRTMEFCNNWAFKELEDDVEFAHKKYPQYPLLHAIYTFITATAAMVEMWITRGVPHLIIKKIIHSHWLTVMIIILLN